MCGICGFTGKTENQRDVLYRMMEKIRHRGPDSEGMFLEEDVAIGFRRLSIIDLDNGSQPMENEDGSLVVTMNGEIYNYKELREELLQKGHVFKNDSDTECLLHGYEEYGKDLVQHLRGMFAFVIWDRKGKRLYGARDFFGIKPFYYAILGGNLVYASEIKSILEYPGYKKELNHDALEAYLSFQYSALEETFFKNIYKLKAGHHMTFQDGEIELEQYWSPTFTEGGQMSFTQAVDEIDRVLADSVKYHMVSDVEVGALLSSGVDSSFLVSRFQGAKSFSVGFANDNHNELEYAEKFSNHIQIENDRKTISSEEYFAVLPKVQYHMDEPLADASCVALYLVDEMAAKKVKVVLSGEGADELFGGYVIYHEPLSLRIFRFIPGSVRRWLLRWCEKSPRSFKGKNFIRRGCTPLEERFIGNANRFTKQEVREILKHHNVEKNGFPQSVTAPYYAECHVSEPGKMQYIDMNLWLVGDILLKADKMSMAHSLESRVPYLDKEVFAVARQLPLGYKIHKNVTKYAFRECANRHIPGDVAQKAKLGFPVPLARWLRQEAYYNQVKEAFTGRAAEEFFEVEKIVKLLEDHKSGKEDESKKIWTIYMFLLWYDIFFGDDQLEAVM